MVEKTMQIQKQINESYIIAVEGEKVVLYYINDGEVYTVASYEIRADQIELKKVYKESSLPNENWVEECFRKLKSSLANKE